MKFEQLISTMMRINTMARLWHWMTDRAQHHTTFEAFLTTNETLTDSLMESALGNELDVNLNEVGVQNAVQKDYSIEAAREEISKYRSQIFEAKKSFENSDMKGSEEFITILDDVTENASKSLYLLKLK